MWLRSTCVVLVLVSLSSVSLAGPAAPDLAPYMATPEDPIEAGRHATAEILSDDDPLAGRAESALDLAATGADESAGPTTILAAASRFLADNDAPDITQEGARYSAALANRLGWASEATTADAKLELARDLLALQNTADTPTLTPQQRHQFDDLASAMSALLAVDPDASVDEAARADIAHLRELDPEMQAGLTRIIEAYMDQLTAALLATTTGDMRVMVAERAHLVEAVRTALPALQAGGPGPVDQIVVCRVLALDLAGEDSFWPHDCPVALSIDLGGNDEYQNSAGGAGLRELMPSFNPNCPSCYNVVPGMMLAGLAIDTDGDDVYRDAAVATPVPGLPGPTIHLDRPGGAYGAASVGGLGALFDLTGNDTIDQQRAAGLGDSHGVGLYVDLSGDDNRDVGYGNGRGSAGSGFLFDGGGNDTYHAGVGNGAASVVGTEDLPDSPGLPGGPDLLGPATGTLVDLDGTDTYTCFGGECQGAARLAVGVLADLGTEPDTYHASNQWGAANGASEVAGAGVLIDGGGDNSFFGSHDATHGSAGGWNPQLPVPSAEEASIAGGFGALITGTGNDHFLGRATSPRDFDQGAAAPFGLGMLVDQGGNNEYVTLGAPSGNSVLGFGQGAADRQGTGILVDRGSEPTLELGGGVRGQGSSDNGIGLIVQPTPDARTSYDAAVGSFPSLTTGGGIGMRLHRGAFDLSGVTPAFKCPPEDATVFGAENVTAANQRVVTAFVCLPSSDASEAPIRNPITGEALDPLPRPAYPCDTTIVCQLVEDEFGPEARAWLESDELTMTTGGGLQWISGQHQLLSRYTVATADDACQMSCAVADRVLVVG